MEPKPEQWMGQLQLPEIAEGPLSSPDPNVAVARRNGRAPSKFRDRTSELSPGSYMRGLQIPSNLLTGITDLMANRTGLLLDWGTLTVP